MGFVNEGWDGAYVDRFSTWVGKCDHVLSACSYRVKRGLQGYPKGHWEEFRVFRGFRYEGDLQKPCN